MSFADSKISYRQTNSFSRIVNDYLDGNSSLDRFYKYKPTIDGIREAIRHRNSFPLDRERLSGLIKEQYSEISPEGTLSDNINKLKSENCFTITTAHQPNIFTGHLYFIYKIIHVIRLADELKKLMPENDFVPVFYMGSEDADLDELGEIIIEGKKYTWRTNQKGAVGRMKVDNSLIALIDEAENHLSVKPNGNEIIRLLRESYQPGKTIEQATFKLVNLLFSDYGLIVLFPDNKGFKKQFLPVLRKEISEQFSNPLVGETISEFPEEYKVQAAGRELNLFYLKDDLRERIEVHGSGWKVVNTSLSFTKQEMETELNNYPERFSPNVILRPLFQETILPNIVFVGGGGELAYWLELKKVFEACAVPFPVLMLRNSFAITDRITRDLIKKLNLSASDLFRKEQDIAELLVKRETSIKLSFADEKQTLEKLYSGMAADASAADITLRNHVENLRVNAIKKITELEKKMLRAEKRKYEASVRQIKKIRERLYPGGILQERVDNLLPYYAEWGKSFIQEIYDHSEAFSKNFTVLSPVE